MKFLDEYRDAAAARGLVDLIRRAATRPWVIMEICGGQTHSIVKYEGEAAIGLEWRATGIEPEDAYPAEIFEAGDALVLDPRPLVRAVSRDRAGGVAPQRIARRFHSAVVSWVVRTCVLLRERTGVPTVALSGGVFMNAILAHECAAGLAVEGFRVLRHRLVPPNDGGLCLGQLAAAAARDAGEE